jgi:hypothetical protein
MKMSVNEIKTVAPKGKLLIKCKPAPDELIKLIDQAGLCKITSSSSVLSSDDETNSRNKMQNLG